MICTDCGYVIEGQGTPECPRCGSTNRTVFAEAALGEGSALNAYWSVGYAPGRSWERCWADLVESRDSVDAYYAQAAATMTNEEATRRVLAAWLAAQALAEHLPETLVPDAMRYRQASSDLRDAGNFANTTKHGGRDAGKPVGEVRRTYVDEAGNHIVLEFIDAAGSAPRERDALALISACVDAWDVYLRQHGLRQG